MARYFQRSCAQAGRTLVQSPIETMDPSRHIRLVEAEVTPELREFCEGLDQVNNYVGQTFSLFKVARERRPKTLLVKRNR